MADAGGREGKNEALFREINERVAELNETFATLTDYGSWVCECATEQCVERCDLTMVEYRSVRAHPTQFLIAPSRDHFAPDTETLVLQSERYWVVEKIGVAATVARQTEAERDTDHGFTT